MSGGSGNSLKASQRRTQVLDDLVGEHFGLREVFNEMTVAAIHDDTLVVTMSYSVGCADHEFTLVVADSFMESDPVQIAADLAHDANGDALRSRLTEELRFELNPVKTL